MTGHEQRYEAALCALRGRRHEPDSYWRAALYALTYSDRMWKEAEGWIDYREEKILPPAGGYGHMSTGEQLLVAVALHLFDDDTQSPRLTSLCHCLNDEFWGACLGAMLVAQGEAPRFEKPRLEDAALRMARGWPR